MAISLVQSKTGDSTSSPTTLTITLTSATTAGNCLVVCAGVESLGGTPTITGVKLGGVTDNFAQAVQKSASDQVTAIWTDQNCAGGQTSVAITESGATTGWEFFAVVFEFSGIVSSSAVDVTSTGSGSSASFSSGTTATTAQAIELFVGMASRFSTGTITGPSSPWTNTSIGGVSDGGGVAGWQVVSSTGTATYSGTLSTSAWQAAVVTLKGTLINVFDNSVFLNQAVRTAAYY